MKRHLQNGRNYSQMMWSVKDQFLKNTSTLQVHPRCCKWQNLTTFYGWVVFSCNTTCIVIQFSCNAYFRRSKHLYWYNYWWTLSLHPYIGYCKCLQNYLVCIFLVIRDIEHIFMCLLALCMSSLPSQSSVHLLIACFIHIMDVFIYFGY